jgi:hypothetical protein
MMKQAAVQKEKARTQKLRFPSSILFVVELTSFTTPFVYFEAGFRTLHQISSGLFFLTIS